MPKKTKKEKIIAEYRRRIQSMANRPAVSKSFEKAVSENVKTSPTESPTSVYRLTPKTINLPRTASPVTASDVVDLAAIRHDLTKTVLLAAITVAIEFGLYWRIG